MGRSNKKSLSQTVVAVGTTGMPSPVRKILGTRVIASVIVVSVPVLIATGLVSVTFESGYPRLTINQPRAAEVKQEVTEKIHDLQKEMGEGENAQGFAMPFGSSGQQTGFALPEGGHPFQELNSTVTGQIDGLTNSFDAYRGQVPGFAAPVSNQQPTSGQASGPISNLKERFQTHR